MDKDRNKRLAYKVSHDLKEAGYILVHMLRGNVLENPCSSPVYGYDGIEIARPPMLRKSFQPVYLGQLWFENEPRRAVPEKRWVFDVYGGESLSIIQKSIVPIAAKYGMALEMVLVQEERILLGDSIDLKFLTVVRSAIQEFKGQNQ